MPNRSKKRILLTSYIAAQLRGFSLSEHCGEVLFTVLPDCERDASRIIKKILEAPLPESIDCAVFTGALKSEQQIEYLSSLIKALGDMTASKRLSVRAVPIMLSYDVLCTLRSLGITDLTIDIYNSSLDNVGELIAEAEMLGLSVNAALFPGLMKREQLLEEITALCGFFPDNITLIPALFTQKTAIMPYEEQCECILFCTEIQKSHGYINRTIYSFSRPMKEPAQKIPLCTPVGYTLPDVEEADENYDESGKREQQKRAAAAELVRSLYYRRVHLTGHPIRVFLGLLSYLMSNKDELTGAVFSKLSDFLLY